VLPELITRLILHRQSAVCRLILSVWNSELIVTLSASEVNELCRCHYLRISGLPDWYGTLSINLSDQNNSKVALVTSMCINCKKHTKLQMARVLNHAEHRYPKCILRTMKSIRTTGTIKPTDAPVLPEGIIAMSITISSRTTTSPGMFRFSSVNLSGTAPAISFNWQVARLFVNVHSY
jgi:hypothetical protein